MDKLEEARKRINEADKEIAAKFEARMNAVRDIAMFKFENGLPVFDAGREAEIIRENSKLIRNPELRPYYEEFVTDAMNVSKKYQRDIMNRGKLICGDYEITVKNGALSEIGKYMNLDRKVLVVTDEGVPVKYANSVCSASMASTLVSIPSGEESKSFECLERLLQTMIDNGFNRNDCVVAVGGGVVGDLAGFAASMYMRGIDFCNVPTTLLSQLDSSVGGKTAVNFNGLKNIAGAFYRPKAVVIDPEVLETLEKRQYASGLAEAVKMAVTCSSSLFDKIADGSCDVTEIITESLKIKISVVEKDEKESGLRRVLNFGHTIGHGIEAQGKFLHGECVALGMLCAAKEPLRSKLASVLCKYGLPTQADFDEDKVIEAIAHDKKGTEGGINMIFSESAGSYYEKKTSIDEIRALLPVIRGGK